MSGMSTATALAQSHDFVIVREAGMCVECDDQPALLACEQCGDDYCDYCFTALHKKGQRKTHTAKRITTAAAAAGAATSVTPAAAVEGAGDVSVDNVMADSDPQAALAAVPTSAPASGPASTQPLSTPPGSSAGSSSSSASSSSSSGSGSTAPARLPPPTGTEPLPPSSTALAAAALEFYPGFHDRVRFAPLRLTESERQLLLILQDALQVSEYTANVDCMHGTRDGRWKAQVTELSSIYSLLLGMSAAHDVKTIRKVAVAAAGAKVGHFAANAHLFQAIFEVGRRHKIRNPDKMRTTYGQMMHLLMDAQQPHAIEAFGFSPVTAIKTIEHALAPYAALGLLSDHDFLLASSPLTVRKALTPVARRAAQHVKAHALERLKGRWTAAGDDGSPSFACPPAAAAAAAAAGHSAVAAAAAGGLEAQQALAVERAKVLSGLPFYCPPQAAVDSALKGGYTEEAAAADDMGQGQGEAARKVLVRSEPHPRLPVSVLMDVINAASDSTVYLQQAVAPVDAMERRLMTFKDNDILNGGRSGYSLAISAGKAGARLTHSHREQFNYVHQTLSLWRLILLNMYKLWSCADADMLSQGNTHSLRNTGQGLNRMQAAPRVGRVMGAIMSEAHRLFPRWVGSSAVHLGDTNVPNALFFIDKYSQVERILAPIVATANSLDKIVASFDAVKAEAEWRNKGVPTGLVAGSAAATAAGEGGDASSSETSESDDDGHVRGSKAARGEAGDAVGVDDNNTNDDDNDNDNDDVGDGADAEARAKRAAAKKAVRLASIDAALDGWAHTLTRDVRAALRSPLYGTRPIVPAALTLAQAQAQAQTQEQGQEQGLEQDESAAESITVASEITGHGTDPLGTCLPLFPPSVYTPERQRAMLSGWARAFYNAPKAGKKDSAWVKKTRDWILAEFFRHAFDGSGADDFFSAGSCIDGRLTSAWNWCSKIESKTYHPLFLATEFVGFEGQWAE